MMDIKTVTNYIAYHIHTPNQFDWSIGKSYDTALVCRPVLPCGFKQCIEDIAELTRENINPNLPSRNHCIYVSKKEYGRYWYNYFEKRNKLQPIVYKLKLTGKLFWTYADYLKAERYWLPNKVDKPQEHEGLFEGTYTIVDQCDIAEFL